MSKYKIAIFGNFQIGKSLLLNCLFNRRLGKVGFGIETTSDFVEIGKAGDIAIFDSMGFDGSKLSCEDAVEKAKDFDYILFLVGGLTNKTLSQKEMGFIQNLAIDSIPYSVLLNVSNENCEDDLDNIEQISKSIQAQLKGFNSIHIFGDPVFCLKPYLYPNIENLGAKLTRRDHREYISEELSGIATLRQFLGLSQTNNIFTLKYYLDNLNILKRAL